jgi:hypothetical protein
MKTNTTKVELFHRFEIWEMLTLAVGFCCVTDNSLLSFAASSPKFWKAAAESAYVVRNPQHFIDQSSFVTQNPFRIRLQHKLSRYPALGREGRGGEVLPSDDLRI